MNPASAGSTAETTPATVTATAATVAGVAITARSVSNITWPPFPRWRGDAPAWNPAGTSTDPPAAGATVKVSRACAAVAGNGVTPAMRRYSTRAFSGSRFTRLSSGSIWIPNSRTRATPESSGAGLVQSGVKPPILACSAARTASLLAGSSSRLAARQPGAVHDHRLAPGLGLPPPPHLAGALRAHGRPPAAAAPLPALNRTVTSPGADQLVRPDRHVAAVFPARRVVEGDGDAGDLAVVAGGLLGDPQQRRGPQRRAERPARGVVAAGQRVEVLAQRELHLGADGGRVARRPGHLDPQPGRAVPGLPDEQFLAQQPRAAPAWCGPG